MATNPNKQGSGYINIRNYLQANPNVNLGKKIGATFNKDLESLDKSFGTAKDEFNQNLQAGAIDTEENKQKRQDILAAPENVDQSKLQEFSRYLNPSFQAPSTAKLETQANTSQNMAQDIVDPQNRTNLLGRYFGQQPNKSYSAGQKTLDTVFLNQPDSSKALGESRRGALQQLGQQRQSLLGAQDQIKVAKGATDQFGKDTQNQLATNIGDYVDEKRGSLTKRLENMKAGYDQTKLALGEGLRTGQFSKDLAGKLGLSEGQSLYGFNNVDQVYNPNNLSLSNVASDAEKSRVNALYKLRGDTGPLDTTQAQVTDPGSFNREFLRNYITQQQTAAQRAADQQNINLNQVMGATSMQPNAPGKVTIKGAPAVSYYQYEDQLKPFFTLPNSNTTVGQARDYAQRLGQTLQKIQGDWQNELSSSNPTEDKRRDVQNFINMWQQQLGKLNSAITQNQENVANTQFGANTKVKYV